MAVETCRERKGAGEIEMAGDLREPLQEGDGPLSALTSAILRSNWLSARQLIDDPGAVAASRADECSPLYAAALRGYPELAAELLRCGFDVNEHDEHGFTALHAAVTGQSAVTAVLLAAGANPDGASELAYTDPLSHAANYGDTASFRLLLRYGASPTSSVLVDAAEAGALEIIALILAAGVDPAQLYEGKTPAEYAIAQRQYAAAALLHLNRRAP